MSNVKYPFSKCYCRDGGLLWYWEFMQPQKCFPSIQWRCLVVEAWLDLCLEASKERANSLVLPKNACAGLVNKIHYSLSVELNVHFQVLTKLIPSGGGFRRVHNTRASLREDKRCVTVARWRPVTEMRSASVSLCFTVPACICWCLWSMHLSSVKISLELTQKVSHLCVDNSNKQFHCDVSSFNESLWCINGCIVIGLLSIITI